MPKPQKRRKPVKLKNRPRAKNTVSASPNPATAPEPAGFTAMPRGSRTFLYESAAKKGWVEHTAAKIFSRWGYEKIITPTLEYYETVEAGLSPAGRDAVIKITEIPTGKLLGARSDVTPQIARIASTMLASRPAPVRLYYNLNVLRWPGGGSAGLERFQSGIELIGSGSAAADAEVVCIAADTLRALGFDGYRLVLGNAAYVISSVEALRLKPHDESALLAAIQKKDKPQIDSILKQRAKPGPAAKCVAELASLFGGTEALDRAMKLATVKPAMDAVKRMRETALILDRHGIASNVMYDMGELRGLNYYTGLIFEGFVKGFGQEICGGGRYDSLLGRFGKSRPATGFALDIDRVLDLYEQLEHGHKNTGTTVHRIATAAKPEFLVTGISPTGGGKGHGAIVARRLRDAGISAAWFETADSSQSALKTAIDYARNAGIPSVLAVSAGAKGTASLRRIDIDKTGRHGDKPHPAEPAEQFYSRLKKR